MKTVHSSFVDYAHSKIFSVDELAAKLPSLRKKENTIATVNGSFDLLHAGHLHILFEAAQQASILIVALNTDSSIKRYKHPSRPIIPLQERLKLIAALSMVDFVTWFDETDPRAFLLKIRPDVHVNGAEYTQNCIEASTVQEIKARLHLVSRIPGLATSTIITTIQNLCEE